MELYVVSAFLSVKTEKHHLGGIRGPRMFKYLWILIILFFIFVLFLYFAYCVMDAIDNHGAKTPFEVIDKIWMYHDVFMIIIIIFICISLFIAALASFIYFCGGLK